MRFRRRTLPIAAALISLSAVGDELKLDRTLSVRVSNNDNLNMQVVNPVSATQISVTPSLKFSNQLETLEVAGSASVTANQYLDQAQYNGLDYSLALSSKWKAELDQYSLSLGSSRTSALNTELQNTGVVTSRRPRTQTDLKGSWSRQFDETLAGSLSYGTSQTRYESGPGLVDFDTSTLSASLTNAISERLSLSLTASGLDYQTVKGDSKSQNYSVSAGVNWAESERWSMGLNVGGQSTTTEISGNFCQPLFIIGTTVVCQVIPFDQKTKSSGTIFSFGTSYRLEDGALSASMGRNAVAGATGTLFTADTASASFAKSFSERTRMNIGTSYTRSKNATGGSSKNNYQNYSASLQHELDRQLVMELGFSHVIQNSTGQARNATQNIVSLNLLWNLDPITGSR
jgi:hypothetical protein